MRVIAGKARRLLLKTVPGNSTRPTTDQIKETLFNMMQPYLPGSSFLDLFAGSGAIGIEALSRGAARAVFVENDRRACNCIRENLAHTRLEEDALLVQGDVLRTLQTMQLSPKRPASVSAEKRQPGEDPEAPGSSFDIIFMDPPYDRGLEKDVLTILRDSPLADAETLIVVEASNRTDFSYLEVLGYETVRTKEYKTNRHLFLRKLVEHA